MGAFFLTRRELFLALNGFDERYFVFWEDLDFSTRAHQAGWRTRYLTEAQAYHRGAGTSHRIKAQRLAYAYRSRTLLGYRHFSWGAATLLAVGTLIIQPIVHLAAAAAGRTTTSLKEVALGYWLLWRSFAP
jgi:GT2 family glycosyltransferase